MCRSSALTCCRFLPCSQPVVVGRPEEACRRRYEEIEVELTLEAQVIDLLETPEGGIESGSTEVAWVRLHLFHLASLILSCCHGRFFSIRLRRILQTGRYAEEAAALIDAFVRNRGGMVRFEDGLLGAFRLVSSTPDAVADSDRAASCSHASSLVSSPPSPLATLGGSAGGTAGQANGATLQRRHGHAEGKGAGVEEGRTRKAVAGSSCGEAEATPRGAVAALMR